MGNIYGFIIYTYIMGKGVGAGALKVYSTGKTLRISLIFSPPGPLIIL